MRSPRLFARWQRLIAQAVQVEFEEFLAGFAGQTNGWGRSAMVRNGFLPEHRILTGVVPIAVPAPKASSDEEPAVFRSALVLGSSIANARSFPRSQSWCCTSARPSWGATAASKRHT